MGDAEPMLNQKNVHMGHTRSTHDTTTAQRYTHDELAEFEQLIRTKIAAAEEDFQLAAGSLNHAGSNGTEDTYTGNKGLEEGNPSLAREELMMLAARQQKFIAELNLALGRIRTGSYGICSVSGQRIPKERLRAVPTATMCIAVKYQQTSR